MIAIAVFPRNDPGPGEMQILPPGVGHVWTEIAEGGIDYMVIRVAPEHVLGLRK